MKKILLSIALFTTVLLAPFTSFSASFVPFGGMVSTIKTPPTVQCSASIESPFMITPAGASNPGPWSTIPGPRGFGAIAPGTWVLGLLSFVGTECFNYTPLPIPFPTSVSQFYGTSLSI